MTSFNWTISGVSDVGKKRQNNEDSLGWQLNDGQSWLCAVVADGMGGHASGEVASGIARTLYLNFIEKLLEKHRDAPLSDEQFKAYLEKIIDRIHAAIGNHAEENPQEKGMGTTLVSLILIDNRYWLINVGDSRCYRLREEFLTQLSHDHTVVQTWIDKGQITEEDAESSPYKNVLTQALGADEPIDAEISVTELKESDQFLLCSDGLTACLSSAYISETMQCDSPIDDKIQHLLSETLSEGAPDNVSLILINPRREV